MIKIQSYYLLFLFYAFIFLPNKSVSQQILKEVSLVYDITLTTSQKSDLVKSFEGATLTVYVKGNVSRTDMTSIIGTESNIFNNTNKAGFILKDYSGQKLMITLTELNWIGRNRYYSNILFENTNDEKVINGFKCKRARVLSSGSYVSEVYFLYDQKINNNNYYNCFSNLSGIPVKYSVKKDDKVFTYTLRSLNSDNILSSKFDEPQSGYRKITYEEALQVKGDEN